MSDVTIELSVKPIGIEFMSGGYLGFIYDVTIGGSTRREVTIVHESIVDAYSVDALAFMNELKVDRLRVAMAGMNAALRNTIERWRPTPPPENR